MYEEELSKAMEPLEHMWLGMEERPTMLDKCKRWLRSRVRGPPSSTMEFQSRFGAQLFQAVLPIQRIQVQMATQAPRTGPPVFKPQPWYGYLKKELLGVVGLVSTCLRREPAGLDITLPCFPTQQQQHTSGVRCMFGGCLGPLASPGTWAVCVCIAL